MFISRDFSIYEFLEHVAERNYNRQQAYNTANSEAAALERLPTTGPRAKAARERGSREYRGALGKFMFFMIHGSLASSTTSSELRAYRPICDNLVKHGDFPESILDLFAFQDSTRAAIYSRLNEG